MEGTAVSERRIRSTPNGVVVELLRRCMGWAALSRGQVLAFAFTLIAGLPLRGLTAEEIASEKQQKLIVVVGASGTLQYEIWFHQWSERWEAAAKKAKIPVTIIGRHRGEFQIQGTDYDKLREEIQKAEGDSLAELWIVLIGHGTYDKRVAKFNLRGPDLAAEELSKWLLPVQRPTAIIDCTSCSGPFLPTLSAANRVVVTATKSGAEINFARFGDFLSSAVDDPSADLDKDQQTSLWEAFLMASRRTAEFYDNDGRISAEHALLDDNGDQRGTRADQFRGLMPIASAASGTVLDGRKAHQWHLVPSERESKIPAEMRAKRNELELAIESLRDRKSAMTDESFKVELERLAVSLAELNELVE